MSDNGFIDEVVNEVLKRLNHTSNQNCNLKENLYLIGPAEVEFLYELESQYHIVTSKDKENPNQVLRKVIEEDQYDTVLMTSLPINSMVNLVNGTYQTFDEHVVLHALLCGKSVTLFQEGIEYKQYKATANKALYAKYIEYEDRLKHYGINIISKRDFTLRTLEKKLVQVQPDVLVINELPYQKEVVNHSADIIDFTDRKLILEKDMLGRKNLADKIIKVSPNCIITPMAQDMIREQRITILRSNHE